MANITIKNRIPVFISSTYEDMIPYREATERVLIRLEQIVRGMEYFGASYQKPLDVCLNAVRESKLYVALIGMRYGSIDVDTGKSFTQLEYEEAIKCGIPTLIYIIGDDCPVLPKFVDRDECARKLSQFKALLKANHTVSFYNSPEDLSTKFTQDIVGILDEIGHIGDSRGIKLDIGKEFEEVFKKFTFRPVKYQSQEGFLTIKITDGAKSCASLKTNVVSELGMTHGDAVSAQVYVLSCDSHEKISDMRYYLYGEKEAGDWLEQVKEDTIVSVKVRLNYFVTPEIEKYDGGSIIRNVAYTNLILLEPPKN